MKKISLIVLVLVGDYLCQAQSIDRKVIASGGGVVSTPAVQLSFTIGETAIQYLSASGMSLCQGFQQVGANPTSIHKVNRMGAQLSIYPNPFVKDIAIKSNKKLSNVAFSMIDITGRRVAITSEELDNGRHWHIQVSNIAAGNYWLRISARDYENAIPLIQAAP